MKFSAGPVQLVPPFVKVGVTVIMAVTVDVPLLIATNALMLPEPPAARPMPGVLFTQEQVVTPPVLLVEKFTAAVFEPLHTVWSAGSFNCPAGLYDYVPGYG